MYLKSYLLLFIFFAFAATSFAQTETGFWTAIEQNIQYNQNLSFISRQLDSLQQTEVIKSNPAALARLYQYRILIGNAKSEDTSFFKQSHSLDSILQHSSNTPLKAIVHLMQAKRLALFEARFFNRNNKILFRNLGGPAYNEMAQPALDSVIAFHFDAAKNGSASVASLPINELLWLSSDPYLFLFQPGFTDVVIGEKLQWLQRSERKFSVKTTTRKTELLLSPDSFLHFIDTVKAVPEQNEKVLKQYKAWADYHNSKDPLAYYFIETLARKYFYQSLYPDSATDRQYETYLTRLLRSPLTTVKAHAVYQLCLLWNKQASRYNPNNSTDYYWSRYSRQSFDSTYRLHYAKALNGYQTNQHLLDSFPFMEKILLAMKEKLLQPQLLLSGEREQLPGKPVALSLSFRNSPALYVQLVQIPANATTPSPISKAEIISRLNDSIVRDTVYQLPDEKDYQPHQCFLATGPLPQGHYWLIYSNEPISKNSQQLAAIPLTATQIAVINNDQKVFVLNRQTGFPLAGASLTVDYRKTTYKAGKRITDTLTSKPKPIGKDGFAEVPEKAVQQLWAIYGKDTVVAAMSKVDNNLPEDVYDKEEYDDLEEYYKEQVRMHLFTDRSIYRPGQKVYFKGIFIIRNPRTGEPLVLNWKNLQLPFYKKFVYRLIVKFGKKKIPLYLEDAFGRNIDTLQVLPNKFGSVAGSFTIPKNAATGDWKIETDDIEPGSNNDGEFKVEEYKRPTFEVNISKPKKDLQLGDSFPVTVQVRSFAGASLAHIPIHYTVERSGYVPVRNSSTGKEETVYEKEDLYMENDDDKEEGTGYTNEKGEFIIAVNDTLLKQYLFDPKKQWQASYAINVEAIDPTGESHEADVQFPLSNRPYRIEAAVPSILDRSDMKPVFIRVNSPFSGAVQKQATVRIYKTIAHSSTDGSLWPVIDTWLYDRTTFARWFPETETPVAAAKQPDSLVYTSMLMAGGEQQFIFPKELLTAGHYRIVVNTIEKGNTTGEFNRSFSVFDREENRLPDSTDNFEYLPYNQMAKGQPIRWVTGNSVQDIFSIYHVSYFAKSRKGVRMRYVYNLRPERKGINEWSVPVPEDAEGEVLLTHLYIFNNHLYHQSQTIYLPADKKEQPQIIVEQYRHQLTPGSANTFSVSIKTKNKNIAAELMSTLYDATLDKIEKHEWIAPGLYRRERIYSGWDRSITSLNSSSLFNYSSPVSYLMVNDKAPAPLWWLKPLNYQYEPVLTGQPSRLDRIMSADLVTVESLQGSVSGLSITNTNGLDEVVVVGYGTALQGKLSGSVVNSVSIRGVSSFSSYTKALFIVDGVVYEGDISKLNALKLTDAVVLTDAAASALYGSRGANGVVLISTKGPVAIPQVPDEPPIVIRKNFNETAFFLPQVHADRHGYYNLSFTLPESVTEWKWKMLGHTKDARFTYLEKSIVSQLPLMVQPNLPRYLHQGDKLLLHSRITNLDTLAASGTATLLAEDVVTGADVTSLLTVHPLSSFSLAAKSNTTVSFTVQVPENFLHPLKIKITARTAGYADGEEHMLPVLSRKILVNQSQPVTLYHRKDTTLHPPALPKDASPFGMGLYAMPKPQSALLSSLAYLVHYPYGCAEQTFNKLLAHATGLQLMQTNTALQHSFSRLPQPEENTNTALPDELEEATMPWLQLNHEHQRQQQLLRMLLDTFAGKLKMQQYFNQLAALQNADGGIAWFTGGKSDLYISTYILAGFGKGAKEGLLLQKEWEVGTNNAGFISKLMQYCDAQFARRQEPALTSTDTIQYLYARSFWLRQLPPADSINQNGKKLLQASLQNIHERNLYQQAILISTAIRFGPPYNDLAKQQLENIRQLAISDTVNGTRWKTISNTDDLNISSEEIVAAIAEAFGENDSNPKMVKGILQWLMQNRETHRWSSTKAAAAVVSLLRPQADKWSNAPAGLNALVNDKSLTATNDLLNGRLFDFAEANRFPATFSINTANSAPPVSGGVSYYYFTAQPPQQNGNNVKLQKEYLVWDKLSNSWQPINGATILRTADKVKTILTITTSRPLQYVLIDDKSAASLEPSDATSGYEYTKEMSYYKSVRDAGFQFFAERVPSGVSTISYETVVAQQGSFSTGITSLQCMYRPDVRSYAQGIRLIVQ